MSKPAAGSAATSLVILFGLALVLVLGGYVGWNYMQTPTLNEISPNPARAGDTVTLRGDRFSSDLGGNIVLFGDRSGKIVRATTTLLEVQVPEVGMMLGEQVRVPVRVFSRDRVSGPVDILIATTRPEGAEEMVGEARAPAAPPASAPAPAPAAEAAARPAPSQEVVPPASWVPGEVPSTAPRKRSRPPASPAAPPASGPDVAALLEEADAAAAAQRHEAAIGLYDRVLQADPQNARAKAGRAATQVAEASLRRSFAPGATVAEGPPVSSGKLKEFDTAGLSMKKPVEVPAEIEFEASPARVKPGDGYSVKVFLKNTGNKPIRVNGVTVSTTVNGARTAGPVPPLAREVPPGRRVQLHLAAGAWGEGVATWSLEVRVASSRGDTYRSLLTWK
jgi:hypothetical protein